MRVKEESEKADLKLSSGHRTGKGVFISIPKKGNAEECSNYLTIALISHASKVNGNSYRLYFGGLQNHCRW